MHFRKGLFGCFMHFYKGLSERFMYFCKGLFVRFMYFRKGLLKICKGQMTICNLKISLLFCRSIFRRDDQSWRLITAACLGVLSRRLVSGLVSASCLGVGLPETEGRKPGDGRPRHQCVAAASGTLTLRSGFWLFFCILPSVPPLGGFGCRLRPTRGAAARWATG